MAAIANISFRVGESWIIDATMHDSCNEVLSIVGAAVQWRLALNSVTIVTLSIGDGITLVGDGSTGECIIRLSPAAQEELGIEPNFYLHECQVTLPDGTVTDQFAGNLEAQPSLFPPT